MDCGLKIKWKEEWPREFGIYWYYSYDSKKTSIVQIRERFCGSGFQAVSADGSTCAWAPEDSNGLWAKVECPLPWTCGGVY